MKQQIKETASTGSVGAHAIAAAPGRLGSPKKRTLKSFLVNYYDSIGNKFKMIPVNLYTLGVNKKLNVVSSIKESFNLDSVLAQLSSYENKFSTEDNDVVTYGVEDDKGNLMKVTVLNTQADDFEAYISAYLSQLKDFENSGVDLEDISLAELLYKLKDLFDIRDVEFPNIPEDTVYNADEASDSVEGTVDMGMEAEGGDEFSDDEFGVEDDTGEVSDNDEFGGDELNGAEFGDDEFSDDESVEDFEDLGDEDTSVKSILNSVMDMLKAQAEEQKARYESEAEKARAQQAEYTARAAEATLTHKEEFIAMQAEKNTQKADEKKAKQEADLATYRYKKSKGMVDDANPTFEGFSDDSLLMQALLTEEDLAMDPMLIRRQEMIEKKAYQAMRLKATSEDEKRNIDKLIALLPRKFLLKRQEAKARMDIKANSAEMNDEQNTDASQNPQNQQTQQNPQNQQPVRPGLRNQQGQMRENVVTETITAKEYAILDNVIKRQFKSNGNKFTRTFRQYGKAVSVNN